MYSCGTAFAADMHALLACSAVALRARSLGKSCLVRGARYRVQDRFVANATQLYRSDFFPGLGWMLNRRVWESIRSMWWVPDVLGG